MKKINTYIIEKLHLNDNVLKQEKYEIVDGKSVDEIEDWIHNEWNGEDSFLITKSLSATELSNLVDYMYELDNNIDPGRAEYNADDDYSDKYWLIHVDLNNEKD